MNSTSSNREISLQRSSAAPRAIFPPFNPVLSVCVGQQSIWATPRPSNYKDFDADDDEFSPFPPPAASQLPYSTPRERAPRDIEAFAPFKGHVRGAVPAHIIPYTPSRSQEADKLWDAHAQDEDVPMAACDVEYITAWSTFVTIDTESERGQTPDPSTPLVLARSLYSVAENNVPPESPSPSPPDSLSPASRAVHRFASLRHQLEHDACARALPARQAAADYVNFVMDDILPSCQCCRREIFHRG